MPKEIMPDIGPEQKLKEFLNKEQLGLDVRIEKRRSADTGAWFDVPTIAVFERKE